MARQLQRLLWGVLFLAAPFLMFAQTAQPTASVGGGKFTAAFSVSLSAAGGNAIYYTLDGSEPTNASARYSGPLSISQTSVLRARAYDAANVASFTTTHTYLFNVTHTFPVVCLSFKDGDFFDPATGIYPNFEKDLTTKCNVEFFEPNSNNASLNQAVEVEIQGSASATLPQKSLELKAKKALGNATMPYQVFKDLPYTEYKRIVLRNAGQDWNVMMFRDEFVTSLFADLTDLNVSLQKPELFASAHRPSVVYFNGKYWGIHNVRERMKTAFVEQHFNLASTDYDLIENEFKTVNGDSTVWLNFLTYLNSGINFGDNANFDQLKQRINYQNYLDYNTHNIYIDNEDWPSNNNRRFLGKAAGSKWQWLNFDHDFSFGLFQLTGGFNTGDATPNALRRMIEPGFGGRLTPAWSTVLFRKLLQNQQFRYDYVNRTADMMNTIFSPARLNSRLDQFKNVYAPEIAKHATRWGNPVATIWEQNIQKTRNFSNNRPAEMRKHMDEQVQEVTGWADVTVSASPAAGGSVKFSTVSLNQNNYPWTGTYFTGVKIPIQATPAAGYRFVRWSNGDTNPNTTIDFNGTLNLQAIFETGNGTNPCDNDTQLPVFANCPTNQTLNTVGTCANATWTAPTASDNCSTPSVSSNFSSGFCFNVGTTTVTYTATDARGNRGFCNFNVTVNRTTVNPCDNDTQAPVFNNCPANQTLTTTGTCANASWTAPTASDNCSTPSVSSNFSSGNCFNVGTTTVTYTVTDAKGNRGVCNFNVTVNTTTPPTANCNMTSKLLVETWNNTNNECNFNFLSTNPSNSTVKTLPLFESPTFVADNFGARYRGYVCAPETGNYTFYIACDNGGELNLSTDESVANKRRIAFIGSCDWAASRDWFKYATQKSVTIALVAGQKYFIEAYFKEITGGDNLAIGWSKPSNSAIQVIPGSQFSEYVTTPVSTAQKCYKILARHSGKAMVVESNSTGNGVKVVQRTYNGSLNHIWRIVGVGNGFYKLSAAHSGKVLDVSGVSQANEAPLQQYQYLQQNNQQWGLIQNANGSYTIRARHSNKVADVFKGSNKDNAPIVQYDNFNYANQQWNISEVGCPAGAVQGLRRNATLAGGAYRDGNKILVQWASNADEDDYFVVEKVDKNGDYVSLGVINADNANGAETYSLHDNQPEEGSNFYRIQMNRSGSAPQYSDVFEVKFRRLADFEVYPNPANDYIDINIEAAERGKEIGVVLISMDGKVAKYQKFVEPQSKTVRLELENIEDGAYFIHIEMAGKRKITRPVVIMR
jgi:CotH kinase protein/Ricin-type beta-trefoil lectin domain-like/HYR domain/Chitobiase/beta-hexosaminidase C-terminal domain/PA14 domain/Secretion system C-terminal sorting domain/Divergent InlB B-repeat domain